MRKLIPCLVAAAALATCAVPTRAATFYFHTTGKTAFDANALGMTATSLQNFNAPPNSGTGTGTFTYGTSNGGPSFSVSETGGGTNQFFHTSENNTFDEAIVSGEAIYFGRDNVNSIATFTFTNAITAFGIYFSSSKQNTVTVAVNGQSPSSADFVAEKDKFTDDKTTFVGVTDAGGFTTITFSVSAGNDPYEVGFDDLAVPVPSPAAAASGVAMLSILTLRRRRQA